MTTAPSRLWLTPDEVIELTGKKRWPVQCRLLAGMGIPFRPNAAGRPLVERAVVCSAPRAPTKPRVTPNWSALHGPSAQA